MSAGRCAGCGRTDSSCKKIQNHMRSCPDAARLYRTDPTKVLDPADEYTRFKLDRGSQESKDEARSERLEKRFAAMDVQRQRQLDRFQPKDVLD